MTAKEQRSTRDMTTEEKLSKVVPTLYRFASAYRKCEDVKAKGSLSVEVLESEEMLEYRYREAQDLLKAILGFRA